MPHYPNCHSPRMAKDGRIHNGKQNLGYRFNGYRSQTQNLTSTVLSGSKWGSLPDAIASRIDSTNT